MINEIFFNKETAYAIEKNSLKDLKSKYQQKLIQLTKKCHSINDQLVLSKIKSLILDLIHQISVIDLLIGKEVKTLNNWNWFKQLKFANSSQGVNISMADANF